ncbi:hypothetical protein LJR225_003440 [Phenylobacterium sp. LjRoot225]
MSSAALSRSPWTTPCRFAWGWIWLAFHLPSIRLTGISGPAIARIWAAT